MGRLILHGLFDSTVSLWKPLVQYQVNPFYYPTTFIVSLTLANHTGITSLSFLALRNNIRANGAGAGVLVAEVKEYRAMQLRVCLEGA